MPGPPRLPMSPLEIVSVVLGLVVIAQAALWWRLRRRPLTVFGARLDGLESRLVSLEQRLVQAAAPSKPAADEAAVEPRTAHPRPPSLRRPSAAHRVDPPAPSAVSGPTLISVPSLSTPAAPSSTEAILSDLGRRFGPIWDQADAGATPEAIARSTGQPIGQVELILALRRQLAPQAGELRPS